jgi:DUF1680 family protein
MNLSRRRLLQWAAMASAFGFSGLELLAAQSGPGRVRPFPLQAVRLKPSVFHTAVQTNTQYLLGLSPDRLLHNYHLFAGLAPKAPVYGGWELDTIAGHTLGHYLSALSLTYAQTGNQECKRRVDYIVAELAACQAHSDEGYVAGFTRRNSQGEIENGRVLFDELVAGDIRVLPFNLNGCWVPLYNWHKLYAGLFDAQTYCENLQALEIAVRLGAFIDGFCARLSDTQMQHVLDCEHGGINESFAELSSRTGDRRWLMLSERLNHHKVLDPLAIGQDDLPYLHANTQIPKVLGLARQFELTGEEDRAAATRFFWQTVTSDYTYVIGGNSDREYFQEPDSLSKYITEQTCEHCNSYNMLKLTRYLYQWNPDAALFDYYERTHYNHVLAAQHPQTGMFAYMMPLMSGTARGWSTPFDDFWCCVGSGMESHAKHGDSIYWHDDERLYVNLYIPSVLNWKERGLELELDTGLPFQGEVSLLVQQADGAVPLTMALRIPGWATDAFLKVNGEPVQAGRDGGYALVTRNWQAGDTLNLSMPLALRLEPTQDDPQTVAVLRGPLVLAADLGAAESAWAGPAPALVGDELLGSFKPMADVSHFKVAAAAPEPLTFVPFFSQYDRRSAVYFKQFDPVAWERQLVRQAEQAAIKAALDARSIDRVRLGDEESEAAHRLRSEISYAVSYRGQPGRDARTEGFFEFEMSPAPSSIVGPLVLRLTYWGGERRRRFGIVVNGRRIADEVLEGDRGAEFVDVDYPLPEGMEAPLLVRLQPEKGFTAGPVFGARLLQAEPT